MEIPRIIHQTWRDYQVPEPFVQMSKSWKDHHTNWEYMFWTDEMNRSFIQNHFPFFLTKYDGYTYPIQRVDAVRYFILYQYGGFFIDMDFECLANIEFLIGDAKCVFGKEPVEHCDIHNKQCIISNAFMGVIPRFPFFDCILKELFNVACDIDHPNDKVLETTGPFMLSRSYDNYPQKDEISLLESECMYPLTKTELSILHEGVMSDYISNKLKAAYGIHHYSGTWWKKK